MRRFVVSLSALALLPILCPKPAMAEGELLIYGGQNNRVFLGCINCDKSDPASIFNKYGDYGSRFSSTSIFNRFGDYGSKFSNESICAAHGTNPPVVVDNDGNFYGALTANRSHKNLTRMNDLRMLVAVICK
ncbi:MAG TPA: hypothetical protein V6C46_06730 [Coleofasciculaceae cyanobacterium]